MFHDTNVMISIIDTWYQLVMNHPPQAPLAFHFPDNQDTSLQQTSPLTPLPSSYHTQRNVPRIDIYRSPVLHTRPSSDSPVPNAARHTGTS